MASTSKPRQPRLRASCDGCFLAKVKCSKARPICSRCLTCGIECRYSPSSRAGKPKADSSSHSRSFTPDANSIPSPSDNQNVLFAGPSASVADLIRGEASWATPPIIEGVGDRSHSLSSELTLLGTDEGAAMLATTSDMYPTAMIWTPPADSAPFIESPIVASMPSHARSQSYDMDTGMFAVGSWRDPHAGDIQPQGHGHQALTPASTANYFPSPSATPNLGASPSRLRTTPSGHPGSHSSCTCFTVCLQSLQALHNASSPMSPPFDVVLSLNRKAVEGCASMLACVRCMKRSGTHTAAMLLGTVMGKITSFYKNASQAYFEVHPNGPSPSAAAGLGVSLGTYQVNGEDGRWLELEILARELRKLEEVYARFREVCAELSEDPEVSKAMIGYLSHTLGATLEVVTHRKGNMTFG